MDSPQYETMVEMLRRIYKGFKPYYKWIVLNTVSEQDAIKNYI